jgi:hypothetical protein
MKCYVCGKEVKRCVHIAQEIDTCPDVECISEAFIDNIEKMEPHDLMRIGELIKRNIRK